MALSVGVGMGMGAAALMLLVGCKPDPGTSPDGGPVDGSPIDDGDVQADAALDAAPIDETGPGVAVTQEPGVVPTCRSSQDDTRIEFMTATDPPEPNGPVRFECSLDDGTPIDCTVADGLGTFAWNDLASGSHQLVIVAYDSLGNAGPEVAVDFVVDAAPTATIEVTEALWKTDGPITSGSSDVNLGFPYLIRVAASDASQAPQALSCTIDATTPCVPVDSWVDDTTDPDTYLFSYSFAGLADENDGGFNPHQVVVTLSDQCGPGDASQASLQWIVDSTPAVIQFDGWDQPSVVAGAPGPAGDVTDHFNTLHFTLFDEESDGSPDEVPTSTECIVPGDISDCDFVGYSSPAVTLIYEEEFAGAPAGENTATVFTRDEVGNEAQAALTWCVDDSGPVTAFVGNSPQVGTCQLPDGTIGTHPSGVVEFTVVDQGSASCITGVASVACTLRRVSDNTIVAGYDAVDCTDLTFEFGTNAGLAPLPGGGERYQAIIQPVDVLNNGSTATRVFAVMALCS